MKLLTLADPNHLPLSLYLNLELVNPNIALFLKQALSLIERYKARQMDGARVYGSAGSY